MNMFTMRRFGVLSAFFLTFTLVAQPLTSTRAVVAPPSAPAASPKTPAAQVDGKSTRNGQQRAEAIQTAFTNAAAITIPGVPSASPNQPASPYPSTINVTGLTGAISAVTVRLNGFHHANTKDVDALLVGPTGATFIFMSDIGGAGAGTPAINLTFDDAAATLAPNVSFPLVNSTFKPTDNNIGVATDTFVAPAPAGPYGDAAPTGSSTFTSVYGGSNPNGNWSLYITDDIGGDNGACDGGWTIDITTSVSAAPTTTTVQSSLNPALTTQVVSFTAHVVKTSDSSNVTVGTVTFVDNSTSTVLAANVPLDGGGNASTPATLLTERRHLITATYNPDPAFLGSSGSVIQTVDFPTSNPTAGEFCNTNSITVPESGTSGTAVQYPSHITVGGLGAKITSMVVTLNNVTHTAVQDMDVLLVGPGGQNLIIVSDTGSATSNVTVDFSDAAPTQLAIGVAWGAPGSTVASKPVDNTVGDSFPAPAPAGPYNSPTPVGVATLGSIFNNTNPNGVWSLYIIDDAGGDSGAIAGGWCLTFTTTAGAPYDFDGDGISDYAVVRDSGLPIAPEAGNGDLPSASVFDSKADFDDTSRSRPLGGRSGTYFRMPGERFDPQARLFERQEQIEANQLRWLIHTSGPTADLNILFGTLADFPVPADYDGDGKCDVAVWTGGAGAQFRVLTSSSGYVTTVTYALGTGASDPSVVADYDGDGKVDPAVFNSTTGQWSYLGGATHATLVTVTPVGTFGGAFPVPGDYNGDGKGDFMIETRDGINQTMGHFFQWNNNGTTTPPATTNFTFGNYKDVAVPGDYNGDGSTDIALASVIVNPIQWRIRITGSGTMLGPFNLGNPVLDYTLGGDYDGGGSGDLSIWHAPGQYQSLLAPTFVTPTLNFSWGQAGDYPVAYFNSH
jgi:subtilisin-like proprotein convertase family protein